MSRGMSQMPYLVSSGFRRQSCRDSASCPWARQKRMKARPFPRGVFSCKVPRGQGAGVVSGQRQLSQPREREDGNRWLMRKGAVGLEAMGGKGAAGGALRATER